MVKQAQARRQAQQPRRGRAAPPENENSRQRFERIGSARMRKAIYGIRLLGNLANGNYAYTDEDVRLMREALAAQVEETLSKFKPKQGRTDKSKVDFAFGSRQEASNDREAQQPAA